MTLANLSDDELITFISLARIVIRADLEFSEDEEDALGGFGEGYVHEDGEGEKGTMEEDKLNISDLMFTYNCVKNQARMNS